MDQEKKGNIIYASKILIPIIVVICLFLGGISTGIITFENQRDIDTGKITATIVINFGDGTLYSDILTLENSTVFDFLLEVEKKEEISVEYTYWEEYDSYFIDSITYLNTKYEGGMSEYWAFYVNGQYAMEGANKIYVQDNDLIEWKFETF